MTGGCPAGRPAAPATRRVRADRPRAPLARALFLFACAAILLMPLFAHGCHGDDVDHEPGGGPPAVRDGPERHP